MDDQTLPGPEALNRREAVTGLALGGATLGLAGAGLGLGAAPAAAASRRPSLNLDDAHDNAKALLKLQADLSGQEVIGVFPGEVWAWIPGEANVLLWKTVGIGVSRLEWLEAERAYRFYHREALLYLDPRTGEVPESWLNPWTGRRLEVIHILNDHVNRYYPIEGGRFPFPWAYEVSGDNLVFRISVFRLEDNIMSRREYPLHSQDDKYQTTEMWGMIGRLGEVQDPKVTSADCVTSWSRISGWLPWMEMGNAPGQMVYHSHSYKLRNGRRDLLEIMPANVQAWLEKNWPQYAEAPREWRPPSEAIGIWKYTKGLIDQRRPTLRDGQTPFSWPRPQERL